MNLLIIDDHPLIRFGLEAALGRLLPGALISAAASSAEALAALNKPPRPDVILLDLRLPTLAEGITLLRQVRTVATTARVLVVSVEESGGLLPLVQAEGASGFISKSEGADRLVAAIQNVLSDPGKFYCSDALRESSASGAAAPCPDLIPRVWQVYAAMASGKPNKVIARELDISEGSVKNYVTRILEATASVNRGSAIQKYSEHIERWRVESRYRGGHR
jgi:two-component system nitrate/nitrite response regulator NarL